jgi:hypothetical protein
VESSRRAGSILFPVSLVLINVRTTTHGGTVALSGVLGPPLSSACCTT